MSVCASGNVHGSGFLLPAACDACEVRRLRAAIEAALVPAAHIDKDDEAGDAVVRTLLAALEADR